MCSKHLLLISLISLFSFSVNAQREERASASFTYYAHDSQSLAEAKYLALQMAQRDAISKVFGTNLTAQSNTILDNGGEHFAMVAENQVRAVWLRDITEPQYVQGLGADGEHGYSITCTVEGMIRELKSSLVECQTRVYNGGFGRGNERTDFRKGDKVFMSFQTPIDGFLAVYCYNCDADEVGCALPYERQHDGIYRVKANHPYQLFSKKAARGKEDYAFVQEYAMHTDAPMELNVLYVIFSPNKFYKATDEDGDSVRLRNLSYSDFNRWLCKRRTEDPEMSVTQIPLTIKGDTEW